MRHLLILLAMIISVSTNVLAQSTDIIQMEYFFDTDPGFGNGTPVPVTAGSVTSTTFDIDISALEPGFHKVCFRVQDGNGNWSINNFKNIFVKDEPASNPPVDIVGMEYFFDTDPGFGNGTPVPVTAGSVASTTFDIDISGLEPGFHKVYFRTQDENGDWSISNFKNVFVTDEPASNPLVDIVAMEYYIDSDPGFGNGINVPLGPDTIIDATVDLDVSGTSAGPHDMYLRVMDANHSWSLINISPFEVSEVTLTALLEGPFNGTAMNTALNSSGNLPLNQPFNVAPWNYSGTESVGSIPGADIVDWVLLETRNANNAASANDSTVSSRFAAFIKNDGSIVGLDGSATLAFNTHGSSGNFVAIYHRNHLGILSSQELSAVGGVYTYDFTTAADKAYNSGQKNLGNGSFGMYAGNANGDNAINIFDKTTWKAQAGTSGYRSADLNMDGQVTNNDKNDLWLINLNTQSQIPH